jgi:hypothetical protein
MLSVISFVFIVAVVLYKAFSIALFESEQSSASAVPIVKSDELNKALDKVNDWKKDQGGNANLPLSKEDIKISIQSSDINPSLIERLNENGYTNVTEVSTSEEIEDKKPTISMKINTLVFKEDILNALSISPEDVIVKELQGASKFDIVIEVGISI